MEPIENHQCVKLVTISPVVPLNVISYIFYKVGIINALNQ